MADETITETDIDSLVEILQILRNHEVNVEGIELYKEDDFLDLVFIFYGNHEPMQGMTQSLKENDYEFSEDVSVEVHIEEGHGLDETVYGFVDAGVHL